MLLVSLESLARIKHTSRVTYKGKTAVATGGNLRLIGVDKDLGMAQGTTAAVTADDAAFRPANGLFVDELDGSKGLGLSG